MAGLIQLVGYNRAKSFILWLGRKLERNQTTNLRPAAFPDMDTTDAVSALKAVASFHTTDIDLSSITVHSSSMASMKPPSSAATPDTNRTNLRLDRSGSP